MKYSRNKPLTAAEVKALPIVQQHFEADEKGHLKLVTDHSGFTPTSEGFTGQQIKKLLRNRRHTNNRKSTAGRVFQNVPIYAKDDDGNRLQELVLTLDQGPVLVDKVIGVRRIQHTRQKLNHNLWGKKDEDTTGPVPELSGTEGSENH